MRRKNPVTKEVIGVCRQCSQVIKCSGGSTTSLKSHMKSKHNINCDSAQ